MRYDDIALTYYITSEARLVRNVVTRSSSSTDQVTSPSHATWHPEAAKHSTWAVRDSELKHLVLPSTTVAFSVIVSEGQAALATMLPTDLICSLSTFISDKTRFIYTQVEMALEFIDVILLSTDSTRDCGTLRVVAQLSGH
jgi:hypothetical protein